MRVPQAGASRLRGPASQLRPAVLQSRGDADQVLHRHGHAHDAGDLEHRHADQDLRLPHRPRHPVALGRQPSARRLHRNGVVVVEVDDAQVGAGEVGVAEQGAVPGGLEAVADLHPVEQRDQVLALRRYPDAALGDRQPGARSPLVDRLEERLDHPRVGDVARHMVDVNDVDLADHVDDAVGARAGGLDPLPETGALHGDADHGPDVGGVVEGLVGGHRRRQAGVVGAHHGDHRPGGGPGGRGHRQDQGRARAEDPGGGRPHSAS